MKPMRRKEPSVPLTTSASALEIRQMRAFVALVDAKRVTAAAEVLGLAQSTVSEALAALSGASGRRWSFGSAAAMVLS